MIIIQNVASQHSLKRVLHPCCGEGRNMFQIRGVNNIGTYLRVMFLPVKLQGCSVVRGIGVLFDPGNRNVSQWESTSRCPPADDFIQRNEQWFVILSMQVVKQAGQGRHLVQGCLRGWAANFGVSNPELHSISMNWIEYDIYGLCSGEEHKRVWPFCVAVVANESLIATPLASSAIHFASLCRHHEGNVLMRNISSLVVLSYPKYNNSSIEVKRKRLICWFRNCVFSAKFRLIS